jgi:hypothetical protein
MQRPARKTLLVAGGVLAAALALGTGAALAGGGWHGHGPGGMGRGTSLFDNFDTNKDGKITQAEIDAARDAQLKKHDRDGNGALSLEEYQALWVEVMRPRMVRQFQAHDEDGDASVTVQEFQERFSGMVRHLDRNDDGEITMDELRRRGRGGDRDDD